METVSIAIIGAGIVGLSIAARLSETNEGIYVFEKNKKFGLETSSHNSAVLHSGIHYPKNTLKARLCVRGNRMNYQICEQYGLPFKKLGKLTVAVEDEEIDELEKLMRMGQDNETEDLRFLDKEEIRSLEPNIKVERALYTPSTGIIEPDELMNHFCAQACRNNVVFSYGTMVEGLRKTKDGYEIKGTSVGEKFTINAKTVINCAGLYSDKIAEMVGLDVDKLGYKLHYCKGDYFRLLGKPLVRMLVYPVPKGAGLGIHLTPDLGGSVRLGPNAYYVNAIDYEAKSSEQEFREDVQRFMPSIREREIRADSSGIRPKLQGPNDGFKDFVIRHEADRDMYGLINLVGLESPALTAAPAIADYVSEIYENEIKR